MNLHAVPRTRTLLDYIRFVYNDLDWRPTTDPMLFEYQTEPSGRWERWYTDADFYNDYEAWSGAPR